MVLNFPLCAPKKGTLKDRLVNCHQCGKNLKDHIKHERTFLVHDFSLWAMLWKKGVLEKHCLLCSSQEAEGKEGDREGGHSG